MIWHKEQEKKGTSNPLKRSKKCNELMLVDVEAVAVETEAVEDHINKELK